MASFWGRLVSAITAGSRTAWATFQQENLIPDAALGWNDRSARILRYWFFNAHYHNAAYANLRNAVANVAQYKQDKGLYKHIRGVYNPASRQADLYVAKVYGGSLDLEKLTDGAVPIAKASDELRDAIRQAWLWSNWGTRKSLYVRWGSVLGDVALKIVDDRRRRKVRMEVVHPGKIADVVLDDAGNVKFVAIEYERTDEATNKVYVYREEIDKEHFATYKDDEPCAFYEDAQGKMVSKWRNEYGFVPLVLAKHKDVGLTWGLNSFGGNALSKIDEINDAASLLNDQVRKAIVPLWYIAGARGPSELDASTDKRDEIPALYGPEGSVPHPLIANVDIGAALENVSSMLRELERDMPELALHRLRESGNLTAPGVRAGYSDAIDRIVEVRGNYDDALRRAQQMAVAIGGYNNYANMERFGLGSYEAGNLDHYIADRPVIEDALSLQEKVEVLIQTGAPQEAVWETIGVPEDQRQTWMDSLVARQDTFAARLDTEAGGL